MTAPIIICCPVELGAERRDDIASMVSSHFDGAPVLVLDQGVMPYPLNGPRPYAVAWETRPMLDSDTVNGSGVDTEWAYSRNEAIAQAADRVKMKQRALFVCLSCVPAVTGSETP